MAFPPYNRQATLWILEDSCDAQGLQHGMIPRLINGEWGPDPQYSSGQLPGRFLAPPWYLLGSGVPLYGLAQKGLHRGIRCMFTGRCPADVKARVDVRAQ